jgi:hypothetical protein
MLWIAATFGAVLLGWATWQWMGRSPDAVIFWGPPLSTTRTDSSQPRTGQLANDGARLSISQPASLAGLGAELDDPRFDSLGRRLTFDPEATIPLTQRWQIEFASGLTEGQYAAQLAALGIELGVLSQDGKIHYVTELGDAGGKRRTGPRADETRPYWTWGRGDLRQADTLLLANAGLEVDDEIILHFLSPQAIERLTELERQFAGREPDEVFRTRFALKRTFRGYEVYVVEQVER